MLQSLFKSETTIIELKSYLGDTREPNFVEHWDDQIAHNDLSNRLATNSKLFIIRKSKKTVYGKHKLGMIFKLETP